jgi:hypothetical protein
MSPLEWIFSFWFFILYISLIFTVAVLTFKKGHTVLGILGIFFPILWLIGAVLPAKPGSRHDVEQQIYWQERMKEMTR